MHSGIRTEQNGRAGMPSAEPTNRRNGLGITGWILAVAAAVVFAVSFWVRPEEGASLLLRVAALVLAAAGTVFCGAGVGRAGSRRLNGFAFCGLLVGAGVLCLCMPQLVAMLS